MDYYSSLTSMSQQSSSLDYASSQLLGEGTQGYTAQMESFQNDFSKEIGDINAEYQGNIAQITGAFARKDTAQEQLVATLEGAGGALEVAKSAKKGYDKYFGEAKEAGGEAKAEGEGMINDLKSYGSQAEGKISEARGRVSDLQSRAKSIYDDPEGELSRYNRRNAQEQQERGIEMGENKSGEGGGKPPVRNITEAKTEGVAEVKPEGYDEKTLRNWKEQGDEMDIMGERTALPKPDLPSVPDRQPSEIPEVSTEAVGGGAEEGVVGGVETAVESGSAVALEETAGEIAVAGAFDPVADVVAGGLMLAGVGVGVYDLFNKKKTEKKIKKTEENAEKVSQAQQDASQAQYDAQVKGTTDKYNTIRNNITANTHAGVAIGVQNMRNTYKSGGTF